MMQMSAAAVTSLAFGMCFHHLTEKLIDKGILTKEEAAKVFVNTANQVREGTEDWAEASLGENVAQQWEKLAEWSLRRVEKT